MISYFRGNKEGLTCLTMQNSVFMEENTSSFESIFAAQAADKGTNIPNTYDILEKNGFVFVFCRKYFYYAKLFLNDLASSEMKRAQIDDCIGLSLIDIHKPCSLEQVTGGLRGCELGIAYPCLSSCFNQTIDLIRYKDGLCFFF